MNIFSLQNAGICEKIWNKKKVNVQFQKLRCQKLTAIICLLREKKQRFKNIFHLIC